MANRRKRKNMNELFYDEKPSLKTAEIPAKLKDVRQNVGDCDFECPHCNKKYHRTLWETGSEWEYDEITKRWKIVWGSGPVTAFVECSCGAEILVAATDFEGTVELFHLRQNGKEVRA